MAEHLLLHGKTTSVLIAHGEGAPSVLYWGAKIPDADAEAVAAALDRPLAHASIDIEAPVALVSELGSGFFGSPGIKGSRPGGGAWAPRFQASAPPEVGDDHVTLRCADEIAGLAYTIELWLESTRDVLAFRVTLANTGDTDYSLGRLALSLPLPTRANEILDFTGRWCDEFHPRRTPWEAGAIINENRRGRSSHDHVAVLFAGTEGFDENHGEVWGFHLGWSGNSRLVAERLSDGRRYLQAGEYLFPGEVELAPGEEITSPWLYGAHSVRGLGEVSRSFHSYLRDRASHPSPDTPRKVLLNTWEAVYFKHDVPTLKRLADVAAEVGAERFVLDDGWFPNRNDDTGGLGDWWVDPAKYPNGLDELVDHVTGLGLEFGLWFEPEMVNPDSELYRAHPEWVLQDPDYPEILGRNQLVLNLANDDAYAYVLEHLDRMLTDHAIGYVKWDMNRDHVQPVHAGRAGTRAQTLALYRLLDELNGRHPDVEFESCSSGGGRADFEILRYTKRIWTSDCNDALERQRIQRGFSMLFPPELMGAHVGPHQSHTTRRTHGLGFRGAIAFMGHLGIEWNLLDATEAERKQVAELVALHKQFRPLLHSGDLVRLDSLDDATLTQGVVSEDKGEALFVYARINTARSSIPDPVQFAHLDPDARYQARILGLPGPGGEFGRTKPEWMREPKGVELSGRTLMRAGLQPPVLDPESALLFHLTRVD